MAPTPSPITSEVVVPGSPVQAFIGFTAQRGEWWDATLTPDPGTFSSIEIDPEGEVAMVHEGGRFVWGRVTGWEPPKRYAQDFWLGHDEDSPTTLEVTFTEESGTTRVRLVHGGWAAGSDDVHAKFSHWDDLLQRYAAHVA